MPLLVLENLFSLLLPVSDTYLWNATLHNVVKSTEDNKLFDVKYTFIIIAIKNNEIYTT